MAGRRYVIRRKRRAEDESDDPPLIPDLVVYDVDRPPRPTGVLDRYGNEIEVVDTPDPIGFVRFKPD